MGILPSFGLVSSVCLLASAAGAHSQQPAAALGQLLSRVEANTEQYKASVPSFVCDEHITSQELHDGKLKHETTVDALFRVTRSASQADALNESREVKSVDGRPAAGKKIKMPISFSGGFSGALAKYLSTERRQCFDYSPDTSAPVSPGTAAFTFTLKEAAAKQPACASIQPGTKGKFVIDPGSMQVTHIERTVTTAAGKDQVLGTASVDFAPILLNGQSLWLPTTIMAFTSETPNASAFRFTAHYSNYHRFAATSTILPAGPDSYTPAPQPK